MKKITIKRVIDNPYGTFGVILDEDIPFAVTLEKKWVENIADVSCIPIGTYICKRWVSPTHGETFRIVNVPDRHNILFHKGNKMEDTKGCILVAEEFGLLSSIPAVLQSNKGFTEFMMRLAGHDEFELTIKGVI